MRKIPRRSVATLATGMIFNQTAKSRGVEFIPGPKLRAQLGISAVTLWRWRHDQTSAFPSPKMINGRLYFPADAVMAWLAKQPEVR
jgi:predicted DNA-binding transcriptional regulator AlpA